MVKFTKVNTDITQYKPKMKPIYVKQPDDLQAIPFEFGKTTVQLKADGEFTYVHLDKQGVYAINRFGRKTEDLPALTELWEGFMGVQSATEMEVLGELYAVDLNGKPLPLPKFIHYLKGNDGYTAIRHANIHLGIFDVLKITMRGKETVYPQKNFASSNRRFELAARFEKGNLANVLPYYTPKDMDEVYDIWVEKVVNEGWEGLVIRNGETYKAKPNCDVDAVIIGVNKNTKGYEKGIAKSVVVALMNDEGNFVVLGDATVPSEAEARALFALTRVKVGEDPTTTWVTPIVVVQISYISLFADTTNDVRKRENTARQIGVTKFVRMKSPHVVAYRKDKKVCVSDVGLSQVGE